MSDAGVGGVDIDSRSFVSRSLVSFLNASRFGAGKSGGGRTYTAWTGLIHRGGACRMTDDRLFFLVEKKEKFRFKIFRTAFVSNYIGEYSKV